MKKKRKVHSVDAMMRFFLQYYNIPTKQDIDKVLARIDRLEAVVKSGRTSGGSPRKKAGCKGGGKERRGAKGRVRMTATEKVISIIKKSPKGIDVSGLKAKSGFEDKKIRNIVFRLSKEGTIRRIGRGVYAMN